MRTDFFRVDIISCDGQTQGYPSSAIVLQTQPQGPVVDISAIANPPHAQPHYVWCSKPNKSSHPPLAANGRICVVQESTNNTGNWTFWHYDFTKAIPRALHRLPDKRILCSTHTDKAFTFAHLDCFRQPIPVNQISTTHLLRSDKENEQHFQFAWTLSKSLVRVTILPAEDLRLIAYSPPQ